MNKANIGGQRYIPPPNLAVGGQLPLPLPPPASATYERKQGETCLARQRQAFRFTNMEQTVLTPWSRLCHAVSARLPNLPIYHNFINNLYTLSCHLNIECVYSASTLSFSYKFFLIWAYCGNFTVRRRRFLCIPPGVPLNLYLSRGCSGPSEHV